MTLSEFLNGYHGYIENQKWEQQREWERARFVLSGLVKDPPSFPWEKEETEAYSEEEKQEILQYHDNIEQRAGRTQELTQDGWIDVDSGPES